MTRTTNTGTFFKKSKSPELGGLTAAVTRVTANCFICSFTRVAQHAAALRRKQLARLAWAKWRRVVRTERLAEEAAAWRCVLWTRKADRVVARIAARGNKERLMDAWLAWKIWYRRERCKTWRRGMSMATRRHFVAWQRHYFAARAERARVKTTVGEMIGSLVDDAYAQCLWRQNLRDYEREDATRHIQSAIHRWSIRIQRQRLAQAFALWQSMLAQSEPSDQEKGEEPQAPTVRAQTFPERFTAAYRERGRTATTKPASSYRRSWR